MAVIELFLHKTTERTPTKTITQTILESFPGFAAEFHFPGIKHGVRLDNRKSRWQDLMQMWDLGIGSEPLNRERRKALCDHKSPIGLYFIPTN